MTFSVYQQIGNGSIRELVAPELNPTANYRFKVAATNKDGTSPNSNTVEWGLVRPQTGSWWTQGQVGIVYSLEDSPSELPAGWWVSELVQSGTDPVSVALNHYSTDLDGNRGTLLATYQIPVSVPTDVTLSLRDSVTMYPITLAESGGYRMVAIKYTPYWEFSPEAPPQPVPPLLLFFIKDEVADTVLVTVGNLAAFPADPVLDFIIMTDGLMLATGADHPWYAREAVWPSPRYDRLNYPSASDAQISVAAPIPHLQNHYPVTLDTTYGYTTLPHNPGNESQYQVAFIPPEHGHTNALGIRSITVPSPISTEFVLKGDQDGRGVFGTVTPLENVFTSYFQGSRVPTPNPAPPVSFAVPDLRGEIVVMATVASPNGYLEVTTGASPLSRADYPGGYSDAPHTTDRVTTYLSYYPYKGSPQELGPHAAKPPRYCINAADNTTTSFVVPGALYNEYGVQIISHYWIPDLSFAIGTVLTGTFTPLTLETPSWGDCTRVRWSLDSNIDWNLGSDGQGSAQRRYYCDLSVGQFPVTSDWSLHQTRTSTLVQAWTSPEANDWSVQTVLDPAGSAFPPNSQQEFPYWHWDGYYPLVSVDQRFRGPAINTPDVPVRYRVNLSSGNYVVRYLGADPGAEGTLGVKWGIPIAPLFYHDNGLTGDSGDQSPYYGKNSGSPSSTLSPTLNLGTASVFEVSGAGGLTDDPMPYVIEIAGPSTGYFDIQPYHEIFLTYSYDDGVFTNVTDCANQYVVRENLYIAIFAGSTSAYGSNGPAWKDAPGVSYWYLPEASRPIGFIGVHKMNRKQNTGVTPNGFADVGPNEIALKQTTPTTKALSTFNYAPFLVAQVQGSDPTNFYGSLTALNSGGVAISSTLP